MSKLGNDIITPRIKKKVYRRLDGSTFTGFKVTFGKSYRAFDKICNTEPEAKEWIRQVESTRPSINCLHRQLI